ncbi:hypothetical protein FB451DRAFT_1188311 [Mycena latifolia]|nr:hypothetical protein FB451DRAFT_1188311 [Mycena latifolia]
MLLDYGVVVIIKAIWNFFGFSLDPGLLMGSIRFREFSHPNPIDIRIVGVQWAVDRILQRPIESQSVTFGWAADVKSRGVSSFQQGSLSPYGNPRSKVQQALRLVVICQSISCHGTHTEGTYLLTARLAHLHAIDRFAQNAVTDRFGQGDSVHAQRECGEDEGKAGNRGKLHFRKRAYERWVVVGPGSAGFLSRL